MRDHLLLRRIDRTDNGIWNTLAGLMVETGNTHYFKKASKKPASPRHRKLLTKWDWSKKVNF